MGFGCGTTPGIAAGAESDDCALGDDDVGLGVTDGGSCGPADPTAGPCVPEPPEGSQPVVIRLATMAAPTTNSLRNTRHLTRTAENQAYVGSYSSERRNVFPGTYAT